MTDATTAALSSLGSDLSFSISFLAASELVEAAKEGQLADAELVAVMLFVVVVVSVLKGVVSRQVADALKRRTVKINGEIAADVEESERELLVQTALREQSKSLLEFVLLLLLVVQRIVLSLTVQVVAVSVRSTSASRAVRVISLLSLVLFFLFLDSSTGRR
jgi:hypothetical protein